MTKKPFIKIEGLRSLRKDIRKLENSGLLEELEAAHKRASDRAVRASKREVPVKTGKLKDSILARPTKLEGRVKAGTPKRVPYAGPIHFGWKKRNISPNEFIYRGINREENAIIKEYEEEVIRIGKQIGDLF